MSRVDIRAAMKRTAEATQPVEIGVDVARFGDDRTQMYKRAGAKVTAHRQYIKKDTQFIAYAAWEMAGKNRRVPIKADDTGVGGGVTDRLRELGAYVVPVNFGGRAKDGEKYVTVADEMWFDFPIDEASIPDDPELMAELSGRLFGYDNIGRRRVEQKRKFKDRFRRSPDKADALLLCFYRAEGIANRALYEY
jgi:hypothetical protein